jgi:hypothetical protein
LAGLNQLPTRSEMQIAIKAKALTDADASNIRRQLRQGDAFLVGDDLGIYHAWNQALRTASGRWVAFLGTGDTFMAESAWPLLTELCALKPSEVLCTRIHRMNKAGVLLEVLPDNWSFLSKRQWTGARPATPPHPGVFAPRHLLESVGGFDTTYGIAADTKLLLQLWSAATFKYSELVTVRMTDGGRSANFANALLVWKEERRLSAELGLVPPWRIRLRASLISLLKAGLFNIFGDAIARYIFDALRRVTGRPTRYARW